MEEPEFTAKAIESMEIRGAGRIARSAARSLAEVAKKYEGDNLEEHMAKVAKRLLSTRPTAVSLYNAVCYTLRGIEETNNQLEAKHLLISNAEKFIKTSEEAVDKIAGIASRRIPENSRVLTHCNSTAAVRSIIKALENGKLEMAYCTESRPKRQGFITAKELIEAKVPVTMIVDSAVRYTMPKIDMVVVGADTICSNGTVVNKIGTSQVALCAKEARVPVTVCAESYKFSPMTMDGERVGIEERSPNEITDPSKVPSLGLFNPVFDFTPPEHVDAVVTELGVMSPHSAYEFILREFGEYTSSKDMLWNGKR